jgi:hypothetical protein
MLETMEERSIRINGLNKIGWILKIAVKRKWMMKIIWDISHRIFNWAEDQRPGGGF